MSRLCGPDFTPSPNATNGAFSATRREVWVTGFDCGAGALLSGRYLTGAVASSHLVDLTRIPPSSLRAVSTEGIGRREDDEADGG